MDSKVSACASQLVGLCAVMVVVCPVLAVSFQGLGIPGGESMSRPSGVSADGLTVVGYGQTLGQYSAVVSSQAWQWTAGTGLVPLGQASGGEPMGTALGLSSDGSMVAGQNFNATSGAGFLAQGGATTSLDDPYSNAGCAANGISPDGSVIVGNGWHTGTFPGFTVQQGQACYWTKQGGQWTISYLPDTDEDNDTIAHASSPNGAVIVGRGTNDGNNEAMVWTKVADDLYRVSGLGDAAGGGLNSAAYAVTPDGRVIVGVGTRCCGTSGLYWYEGTNPGDYTMITLGDLNDSAHGSGLYGVSADGNWAAGYAMLGINQPVAMLWDNYHQKMRVLQDVLTAAGIGPQLQGWTLQYATGITPDGRTVIGYGLDPSGQTQAWIATVPEPVSLALLALAGAGALLRRSTSR